MNKLSNKNEIYMISLLNMIESLWRSDLQIIIEPNILSLVIGRVQINYVKTF